MSEDQKIQNQHKNVWSAFGSALRAQHESEARAKAAAEAEARAKAAAAEAAAASAQPLAVEGAPPYEDPFAALFDAARHEEAVKAINEARADEVIATIQDAFVDLAVLVRAAGESRHAQYLITVALATLYEVRGKDAPSFVIAPAAPPAPPPPPAPPAVPAAPKKKPRSRRA